jgi:hypothetical protein
VNDICEDLQDGLVIIALIEHTSMKSFNLKYNRSPRFPGTFVICYGVTDVYLFCFQSSSE